MTIRSGRQTVRFDRPFMLEASGRSLPAGTYEVVTDEELVEGLSFPVYRRAATIMIVPAPAPSSATEMLTVDPARPHRGARTRWACRRGRRRGRKWAMMWFSARPTRRQAT